MKRLLKDLLVVYPVRFFSATSSTVLSLVTTRGARSARMASMVAWASGFLVLVFSGDRILTHGLQSFNNRSQFRFSRLYNGTAGSDIIFIGNSRGHTFYQPEVRRLTGASTLNLSHNALPVPMAGALVLDYFDLYAPPKKLIVEVSMLTKTESKVISEFKLYIDHSERIRSVIRNYSPRTAAAVNIANLYGMNTELFHRSLYYLDKEDVDWILDKKMNRALIENSTLLKPLYLDIRQEGLEDLRRLIARARAANTMVSLVIAPYYPAYAGKIVNLKEFIACIESKTGLKVHNYATLLSENAHFSDYLHPNKQGSIRFVKKLQQDGVL